MKKVLIIMANLILMLSLVGCKRNSKTTKITNITTNESSKSREDDETMNKTLILKIKDLEVNADWIDNKSVQELKTLSKDGLSIELEMYGGMEQFGSIGKTISNNDTKQTSKPGDIMLYQSNKIVLFYGSNTWSYTKLGHINLSENELTKLLGEENVTISLELK